MTDIVDRLNDSLSAGYNELRKEAVAEIMQLRAKIYDLTINIEYFNKLKTSYEELIGNLQDERDELRSKIEAIEKQEPTMWANSSNIISAKINKERRGVGGQHTCSETKTAYHDAPLYALPGAKGE